jgi:hypothetical protein
MGDETMPRGPKVDPEIKERVFELVVMGERSPAAIYRHLLREFEQTPLGTGSSPPVHVPTERTIARLVREIEPPDSSGPWSLAESTPEDLPRILPVATHVFEITDGRVWPTRDFARWVGRIVAAQPDIPPGPAYWTAFQMRAVAAMDDKEAKEGALAMLTARLGCRPWTPDGRKRWQRLQARLPRRGPVERLLDSLNFELPGEDQGLGSDEADSEAFDRLRRAYRAQGCGDELEVQDGH